MLYKLWCGYYYSSNFTDEEDEAQGDYVTCSSSHIYSVDKKGLKPRSTWLHSLLSYPHFILEKRKVMQNRAWFYPDISIATLAFFWFLCAWNTFFHPLPFSLCVSLDLRWVSWRQYIYRTCFCTHSATLCLLIWAFSPFTFKVIVDMYVLIAIMLIVLDLFL